MWEHLKDSSTCKKTSELEANIIACDDASDFLELDGNAQEENCMRLRSTCFEKIDVTHARNTMKKSRRHSQFCILANIRKRVSNLPTITVVGESGSTLFSISTILDKILKSLLKGMPACCCNSNQALHHLNHVLKI